MTTLCLILWGISSRFYLSHISESEPIDIDFEPFSDFEETEIETPASEEIEIQTPDFVFEMEHEYGDGTWWTFSSLVTILISLFICFMVYHHVRRVLYRKAEEKRYSTSEILPPKVLLRATVEDVLKKMEERLAGLRDDKNRGKIMREKHKRAAHTKSEFDLAEVLKMKGKDRRRQLQKSKDKEHVVIEGVDGNAADSQKEMNSKRVMKNRSRSLFMEQTAGDPASTESPVKTEGRKRSPTVASKAKDEKIKVRVGLAPQPNLRAATAKVLCWSKTIQNLGKSLEKKRYNSKVDYRNLEATVQGGGDN